VKSKTEHLKKRKGFTLLELLVAMVIMVIAMSIAFQAFSGTIRGWKRGMEVMDGIKHGDFAMTQLVAAMNSTIYFFNQRKTYAFTFEKDSNGGLPADSISFVTSSGAFMPFDSPFISGPHRINLFIDDDEGAPALFVSALPAVANPEDEEEELEADPILISREVQGLEIMVWDEENEDWTEEWEEENSIPERIMLTVFVASEDPGEEPIAFSRVIEIPVAVSVKDKLTGPSLNGNSSSGGNTTSGGSAPPGQNTNTGGSGPTGPR
jgi:prepilin-type N-terminal cleavage/methylation domain-containing protein